MQHALHQREAHQLRVSLGAHTTNVNNNFIFAEHRTLLATYVALLMVCIEKTNSRLQRALKALDSLQHLLYFHSAGREDTAPPASVTRDSGGVVPFKLPGGAAQSKARET